MLASLYVLGEEGASAQRCHSVTQALRGNKEEWGVAILRPLLDDRRFLGGYTFAIRREDQDTRLPIRVCDAAAETLRVNHSDLKFTFQGEYKALDRGDPRAFLAPARTPLH